MKTAIVTLKSVSHYSQSRNHETPKLAKEADDDYEARTWRERCHFDERGRIFIPPMAFKFCLDAAAKYLSLPIKGKGKATYTKHFLSGILVLEGMALPNKKDEVIGEWFFMHSTGIRGSGKRVKRCYPMIPKWTGTVNFIIGDDVITPSVFEEVIQAAGQFIGIGRFRPENGGFYGRFTVENIEWRDGA